jgi:hypothetical protein
MAQTEIPEYEVISNEGAFVPTKADGSSELLPFGSRLKTWMPPGPHLAPLNPAAQAVMDTWYDEEHPAADKEGRPLFDSSGKEKMWRPHAQYRIRRTEPGKAAMVEVVSIPTKDETPLMGLAEIMAQSGGGNPNQRPAAAFVQPEVSVAPDTEPAKSPEDPAPAVVATAIPPSTSTITTRKA